jgi:hypothetical protein
MNCVFFGGFINLGWTELDVRKAGDILIFGWWNKNGMKSENDKRRHIDWFVRLFREENETRHQKNTVNSLAVWEWVGGGL